MLVNKTRDTNHIKSFLRKVAGREQNHYARDMHRDDKTKLLIRWPGMWKLVSLPTKQCAQV